MFKILTINPGATSTKLAYYEDQNEIWRKEINYQAEELDGFSRIYDQFDKRLNDILKILNFKEITSLNTVVSRGGLIGPVQPGAIIIDENVITKLRDNPVVEHASNLGAALAFELIKKYGSSKDNAYIYDPVTVDSMDEVCRITGLKEIKRQSIGHHLNMRAVARKASKDLKKKYEDVNVIVVHLGGGSSASAHQNGEVIDFVSDDEIMFSAERSGGVPLKSLFDLMKDYSVEDFKKIARNNAGLQALCGTKDLIEIEKRIDSGDEDAKLAVEAMGLQVSKCIASLAATLNGNVDVISITGGMAHSSRIQSIVQERTKFIAPFRAYPGEFEMTALALGGYRVLAKEEKPHQYI